MNTIEELITALKRLEALEEKWAKSSSVVPSVEAQEYRRIQASIRQSGLMLLRYYNDEKDTWYVAPQ